MRRSEVFVLNYAGALYGGRTLRPVAEALEDLCAAGTIPRPRARLRVLGPPAERARSMLAGLLPDQLDAPGRVPYSESIASMTSAAVNLHVSFERLEDTFHVPVKLYEYLRAGRPILALCPPGASARLIEEARGGWVVAPGDRETLRRVLAPPTRIGRRGASSQSLIRESRRGSIGLAAQCDSARSSSGLRPRGREGLAAGRSVRPARREPRP